MPPEFGSGSPHNVLTPSTVDHLKRLDVVTLFPAMFDGPMTESLLGRARERRLVDVRIHQLRDWAPGERRQVDDRPYGGGPGMVIQAEPVFKALRDIRRDGARTLGRRAKPHVIYLSPQGKVLSQARARALSKHPWMVLLCGHYEGIDERAMRWVDEEISIGDYVLTGGELPAMVVADSVMRWVPGVVKDPGSLVEESFQAGRLDYPHYTRPAVWRKARVPAVLLSGNHGAIKKWRTDQALRLTRKKRPDLFRRRAS